MTRLKIHLIGSAIALGAAFAFASPVSAQDSCDLNGAPNPPPLLGTNSLFCGDFLVGFGSGDNQTLVGNVADFGGDGSTAVGAFAAADSAGFGSSPLTLPTNFSQTAVGSFAFATGSGNVAVGDQAVVGIISPFFSGIQVSGVDNGTAIGSHSLVNAENGTAVGMSAEATAASATAIGQNAGAAGIGGTATGVDSNADGGQSSAYGLDANAVASHASAIGAQADASAADSTALGFDANAVHANSVAIGANTTTTAANQVQVGGRTISGVAAGVAANDAVNVSQLTAITVVNTAQATQITALQAADTMFDTRIDALEAVALDFDEDLDRIDDRASSGTATAIALSGMAFLPGKSFNLTANVGTYRGAHAAALQIGAMIGENMAFNAGIAHGFNKRGGTGARAGITFGW